MKCVDDRFQKILDDIKKSAKTVKVLPSDASVKEILKEKYKINTESLLGILFESTGGVRVKN